MSFEALPAIGDRIDGLTQPITAIRSFSINNRGQYALSGRATAPGGVPDEYFILSDQGLMMAPSLQNIPVEYNGATGLGKLRTLSFHIDMNNRGDVVTQATPVNPGIPGYFPVPGIYVASRDGTVERVVSRDEPLPWWTGGVGDYSDLGLQPRISDDDRVLIEGNATPAGGFGVTHISRFDRDPNGTPSSGFIHTNVAAHGMPVAGGVFIGGGFASAMGSNGRIVLSSVASLPTPDGFGYTLFDEGVPILQQGQPAPVPGYFIDSMFLLSANTAGDFVIGMNMTLQPGAPDNIGMVYNSRRGPVYAEDGLAQQLAVPMTVLGPVEALTTIFTDNRANAYFTATLLMPSGDVLAGLWKNNELLIPLGMDIGDGRTITEFGPRLDVSDNGRWLIMRLTLSDGSSGPMRVYVPAPGVAAMLALSAPVLVGRRRRATRDSAKHL